MLLLSACAAPTTDAVVGSLTLRDVALVLRDDGQVSATFEARNDSAVDRAVTIRWAVDEALRERSVPLPASSGTTVAVEDDLTLTGLVAEAGDTVEVTVTEGFFFRESAETATLTLVVRDGEP